MAWLAEVRIAPAEPLRHGATESALVLNKLRSMSFTSLFTATDAYSSTPSAHKLFLLEVVIVIPSFTSLSTTKIGFLTFVAHVI